MNKKLIFLIIAVSLLASCSCSQTGKNRHREDSEEPEQKEIEFDKKISELKEDELNLLPEYFVQRLASYKSYQSVTKGQTLATVSILGIPMETTQSIDVTVIKGSSYSYLKNESHSTFVNTVHTAYFHSKEVVSNNGGGYSNTTLEDYLKTYGTYPFDNAIEGYTIKDGSITSIEKIESENDYKFKIAFDPEKSTNNVKIQMREFGGLDDYPSISKIEIVLSLKDDFTPIKLELESQYTAKKGMDSSCHQTYTVEYSKIGEEIEIPDLDSVKSSFSN